MSFAQSGMVPFAKLMPAFGVCLASAGVMYYVVNVKRAFGGARPQPLLPNPTGHVARAAPRHRRGPAHAMAVPGRRHHCPRADAGSLLRWTRGAEPCTRF